MQIEIKRWDDGTVIYSGDFHSVKECLEDGVKKGIDFHHAALNYTSLDGASLNYAGLNYASLNYASLNHASLNYASLDGALLYHASLNDALLNGASLNYASLNYASLDGASLNHASLNGASLDGASLDGTSLDGATLPDFQICPEAGEFIAFKKCKTPTSGDCIVTVQIPKNARRTSSLVGRECRAEFVKVLAIDGAEYGISKHDGKTEYRVGEIVRADKFDDDIRVECSNGIQFFMTRKEAEQY